MKLNHLFRFCVVAIILALVSSGFSAAADATWKVGTAGLKITPEKPLWMAGYGGRKAPAEGTIHDLWVKIATIEDAAGHRAVIVAADHLGWPQGMYDDMCAELAKCCKLDRSQLMFTASHTHSGPVLRDALYDIYPLDDNQRTMIEEYSRALEKDVVAAIGRTLADMKPATLWAEVAFRSECNVRDGSSGRGRCRAGTPSCSDGRPCSDTANSSARRWSLPSGPRCPRSISASSRRG